MAARTIKDGVMAEGPVFSHANVGEENTPSRAGGRVENLGGRVVGEREIFGLFGKEKDGKGLRIFFNARFMLPVIHIA